MHGASWLQACSQRGTDFDGEQSPMLIAMFDRSEHPRQLKLVELTDWLEALVA